MLTRLLTIAAVIAGGGISVLPGQAAPPAVYTAAQAAAGKAGYESSCGKCHTNRLTGRTGDPSELPPVSSLPANMLEVVKNYGGKIPPLVGAAFMTKWNTTKDLSKRVNEAVGGFPPDGADEQVYLSLTAYVLQVNGAPAGTQALTADTAVEIRSLGLNPSAQAPDRTTMPVAQQNTLVQKYCAVCHTDASMNGGLSLQHFDAAQADPGVAAMLVSKLTNGRLSPEQINARKNDPAMAALIAGSMKGGAMGAAGLGVPERATQDALVLALAAESVGAERWTVHRTPDPTSQTPVLTAGILRQITSPTEADAIDMYRLTLTCRSDTRLGGVQLAWANGVPAAGQAVSVAGDAKTPVTYRIEGKETYGNGMAGSSGPGAMMLSAMKTLPETTLTVSNLFPRETVVFPMGDLSPAVRHELSTCFSGN